MTVTLLYLFAALMFSVCFYVMMHWYSKRKSAVFLKMTMMKNASFVTETILTGVRCSVVGFIHGYFLSNYDYQIILLTVSKGFMCLMVVKLKRTFLSRFQCSMSLSLLGYYFTGLLLDIFLTADHY